jgi:hypothetical protein
MLGLTGKHRSLHYTANRVLALYIDTDLVCIILHSTLCLQADAAVSRDKLAECMSEVTHLRTLIGDIQATGVEGLIEQLLEQVRYIVFRRTHCFLCTHRTTLAGIMTMIHYL